MARYLKPTTLSLLFILFTTLLLAQDAGSSSSINPENITIYRDSWGIPHIFAPTNPEVAYGLAWANAEDDFFTMQELLVSVQGRAGIMIGKEGAERDFFTHAIGVRRAGQERMSQLPSDYIAYLQGYCDGINAFAESHPKEVRVKGSFPVTPEDIMCGYAFAMAALTKVPQAVQGIMEGTIENMENTFGSNAFSFNSNRTAYGGTMLTINPHQPVEGPFSWYEAHLVSGEGMNIHGALFPGGSSVFLGNGPNLGWAHTFNHLDLVDVFKLEMHPEKDLHYKWKGEWRELEKRPVKLKVKLKSWLPRIGVKKTTYWSEIGAVIKSENGDFYALKMPSTEKIGAGEQWYRMNQAQNFTEFYDAISLGQTTMFNIVYADRYDTIFYINNAVMPKRNPKYDYRTVLPANEETVWTEFHPTEDLVQYVNPECGYVFNTNNLPTNATCLQEQRSITEWPDYFGFDNDMGDNNRALRFMELVSVPVEMTWERMKEIKYDTEQMNCTDMFESIEHLMYIDLDDHPHLLPLQEQTLLWDGCAEKSSVGAAVFLLAFQHIFEEMGYDDSDFKRPLEVSEELYIEALQHAHDHFKKHFDGEMVPLGEIQRLVRGEINLPISGFPDALAANYNMPWQKGRFKTFVGDSYTHFVHWIPGKTFPVMETLHPFGASNREDSPHYTDQMQRYTEQNPKRMTVDPEKVKAEAVRSYHPGQR